MGGVGWGGEGAVLRAYSISRSRGFVTGAESPIFHQLVRPVQGNNPWNLTQCPFVQRRQLSGVFLVISISQASLARSVCFLRLSLEKSCFLFLVCFFFFPQIGSRVSLTGLELFNITQQGLELSILLSLTSQWLGLCVDITMASLKLDFWILKRIP